MKILTSAVLILLVMGDLQDSVGMEVTYSRTKFTAAVYEHAVILLEEPAKSRAAALRHMKRNLDVYMKQARAAKEQGADILVFPEDGLYGPAFSTRASIFSYLEYIPDPRTVEWSPCMDPTRYPHTEVQQTLSCMAKNNSIYIVANMGDVQPCSSASDPSCPPDGHYQYNTDVAYGPDGTLLGRYHKTHLYMEYQFDAAEPEVIYFDTPFGRFGMMTCFDILFHDPAVTMVINNNISNVAFPTAWMDALPLLSAIGFHSSFPRGLGINFLSANLHIPISRFHGSGIYSPGGMQAFYYDISIFSPPKLLVAQLDVLQSPKLDTVPSSSAAHSSGYTSASLRYNKEMFSAAGQSDASKRNFISFSKAESRDKISNRISNTNSEDRLTKELDSRLGSLVEKNVNEPEEFESYLFYDRYTFKALDAPNGLVQVCQKDVCCQLNYTMNPASFGRDLFAVGAFDGLHTHNGRYYFQICTLVKCADHTNRSSCGSLTFTSSTAFSSLDMQGQFTTSYVYPQIIISNEKGELRLAEAESWTANQSALRTTPSFNEVVLSAALFGRDYSRDNISDVTYHMTGDRPTNSSIVNMNHQSSKASEKQDKSVSLLGKIYSVLRGWFRLMVSSFECQNLED